MGLGEFFQQTATTILLFKADVSDAKRGLKELSGEEKKAAEQAIKLAEARNDSMTRLAKGITAANVAMKLGNEVIKFAGDAWKTYEKQALAAGGADAAKARSFRSALNEMGASIDHIKGAIGRLVVALEPLVRAAAFVVDKAAWVIDHVPSGSGLDRLASNPGVQRAIEAERARNSFSYSQYAYGAANADRDLQRALGIAGAGQIQAGAIYTADVANRTRPAQRRSRGGDNAITWEQYYANTGGRYDGIGGVFGDGLDYGMGAGPVTAQRGAWGSAGFEEDVQKILDNVQKLETGRKQSIIEQVFGPAQELDIYAEKMQLLGDAVGIFSGALQSGFDAWVSGSQSATEALNGVFKATITGLASTMFAHALEEGALAVGALARGFGGDVRGFAEAAAHGKAAAAYGAAGVGIGVIARQFGGGGSGGGAAGASGGGYSGPPSSYSGGDHRSGGGGVTNVIYVGEGWSLSPGQQRQQTARAFRAARRELESVDGVRDA